MWRWRRRRVADGDLLREARAGARLAEEIEAFLRGSSGEWYRSRGREVPLWAYVNLVAHAEPDRLRQLAMVAPEGSCPGLSWRGAVALLAREILRVGQGDRGSIRRLQLESRVNLECQLISRSPSGMPPEQLVALGSAYLRDHPSCGPPP
jgi:hypothetical protein